MKRAHLGPLGIVVAMVSACGGAAPQAAASGPAPTGNPSAPRAAHVRVASCTPVGFGFSCEAELEGAPATLETCVGSGDSLGLTPRVTPPVTLTVDVEAAADTDRYCGVLILPSGKHVRIVSVH